MVSFWTRSSEIYGKRGRCIRKRVPIVGTTNGGPYSELLVDFIVIVLESREFGLELALGAGEVDVDGGQLVDTDDGFLVKLFSLSLGAQ